MNESVASDKDLSDLSDKIRWWAVIAKPS